MRPLRQTVEKGIFTKITDVKVPETILYNQSKGKSQAFTISITADGSIPFPQVIIRTNGKEYLYNSNIQPAGNNVYIAEIAESDIPPGRHNVQVEGCKRKEWQQSIGDDWIKYYIDINVVAESTSSDPGIKTTSTIVNHTKKKN
jgi:hypothetical protein